MKTNVSKGIGITGQPVKSVVQPLTFQPTAKAQQATVVSAGGGGVASDVVSGGGGSAGGIDATAKNAMMSKYAQARDHEILNITKAYDDAVAEGKLSQEEANEQMANAIKEINMNAYRDSQLTNTTAFDRGIQNSQQLLGLQAGDNARANGQRTSVTLERDRRVNQLKDRIANLTKQKDLDLAMANKDYDYNLAQGMASLASGSGGGGGGGGSTSSRKAPSSKPAVSVNPSAQNLDKNFGEFIASKQNTALDDYYTKMNTIFTPKPKSVMQKTSPVLPIPSVASNPTLTAWQKMKMFGG
jgi:hypothetical protein